MPREAAKVKFLHSYLKQSMETQLNYFLRPLVKMMPNTFPACTKQYVEIKVYLL